MKCRYDEVGEQHRRQLTDRRNRHPNSYPRTPPPPLRKPLRIRCFHGQMLTTLTNTHPHAGSSKMFLFVISRGDWRRRHPRTKVALSTKGALSNSNWTSLQLHLHLEARCHLLVTQGANVPDRNRRHHKLYVVLRTYFGSAPK